MNCARATSVSECHI